MLCEALAHTRTLARTHMQFYIICGAGPPGTDMMIARSPCPTAYAGMRSFSITFCAPVHTHTHTLVRAELKPMSELLTRTRSIAEQSVSMQLH